MKNKKTRFLRFLVFSILTSLLPIGCNDFVDVDLPPELLDTKEVFSDQGSANAAVRGIYAYATGSSSITYLTSHIGLASDEMERASYSSSYLEFAINEIDPTGSSTTNLWRGYYNIIYQCNNLIGNIAGSTALEEKTRQQLAGEAKFMRALSYFYLVNLYGEVPLALIPDYEETRLLPRSPVSAIYDQIIMDLNEARTSLSEDLFTLAGERIRANRWVATALLARVQLYRENWEEAESLATEVINAGFYELEDLDRVFYADSGESILQFANAGSNRYTNVQLTANAIETPRVFLTEVMAGLILEEDSRRSAWLTPTGNGPLKYRAYSNTAGPETEEANMVIRLAEMYLIRAEARTHQNNLTGENSATSDLDVIRSRANLGGVTAATQAAMLQVIYDERARELFAEWSHRWFDTIRTERADEVFGSYKEGWDPADVIFPIPYDETLKNPNLN
ncbi:RagB/SusD family nutrient uptake outer membrane protein [Sinomicrobium soli]|uniref:RagB/SusD family nutrient uptake outer membrane protein n=1 Tax=Sinomicrobium sp. N-1-3-6 TaxID=2219864 RepID=UPI001375112F|nr:RagB/SusD family nutrient uptake outer membrane protein [Sinomicrobium sp. N-1-3-6]